MTINNKAIYDSVLAGIAASNGAWLNDAIAVDYLPEVSAAQVIATQVDAAIPTIPDGPTLSQRQLIESIVKGVMTGRTPKSVNPSDYTSLAAAIAAAFREYSSVLNDTTDGIVADALNTIDGPVYGGNSPAPAEGYEPVALDATHFEWRNPQVPIAHLTTQFLDLLFDLTDTNTMQLTSLVGGNSVPGSWTLSGLTAVNGVMGPDGLPNASAFTEVGTAARSATWAVANNIGVGTVRCHFSYLPGDQYPNQRYIAHAVTPFSIVFLDLPSVTAIQYPESSVLVTQYANNADVGINNGFKLTVRENGWIDAFFESQVKTGGDDKTHLGAIDTYTAVAEPLSGVSMTVSNYVVEQERVILVSPVLGKTDYSLYQNVDSARPCITKTFWLGGRQSIAENFGVASPLYSNFPAITEGTFYAVATCRNPTPASSRALLTLSGTVASISAHVETSGVWKLSYTDDAGVTTTALSTTFVAAVAIGLAIRFGSGDASLWVDNTKIAELTGLGVATISLLTLFGNDTRAVAGSIAVRFASQNDVTLTTLITQLRKKAGLPDKWKVVIGDGQSNATVSKVNPKFLPGSGYFASAGHAMYYNDYGYPPPGSWTNDMQQAYVGLNLGYLIEARENNEPILWINCAHGGAGIVEWLPGGSSYTFIKSVVQTAVQQAGTTLLEFRAYSFMQGEGDANTPTTTEQYYEQSLNSVLDTAEVNWGPGLDEIVFRLNEWLGQNTLVPIPTYVAGNIVRSAEDNVVASRVNCSEVRDDGGPTIQYTVHFPPSQLIRNVGKGIYRAENSQEPRIELCTPDYPERGTWNVCYIDAEHGLPSSGSNVPSWASRETTCILAAGGTTVPQIIQSSVDSRKLVQCATTNYLHLTDSVLFGQFNSVSPSPIIVAMQFVVTTPITTQRILYLGNTPGDQQAMVISYHDAVTVAGDRYAVDITALPTTTVVDGTLYTIVYVSDGTNAYTIDKNGISAHVVEKIHAITNSDCLILNALQTFTLVGSTAYRRIAIQKPTAAQALGRAIRVYTAWSGMI